MVLGCCFYRLEVPDFKAKHAVYEDNVLTIHYGHSCTASGMVPHILRHRKQAFWRALRT